MRSFRHPRWQHLDYRVKVATTQENKPPTQGTRRWTFTTPLWRCGSILLPSLNAGVPEPTGGPKTTNISEIWKQIKQNLLPNKMPLLNTVSTSSLQRHHTIKDINFTVNSTPCLSLQQGIIKALHYWPFVMGIIWESQLTHVKLQLIEVSKWISHCFTYYDNLIQSFTSIIWQSQRIITMGDPAQLCV